MTIYNTNTNKKNKKLPEFDYPAYEKSDAVKQAEAQLRQHTSSQPAAYQSQYQDQMSSLLSQMQNRPDFRYDADGDALYRQYKDRYIHNGQRAMQDTMGQAAALTGGYGSSYAQNVGQQAYNEYMTGLNDVIPELYQLAMDKYDRETSRLQNRYALYSNLDAQDYSRWQDQQNLWYNQLDRLTSNARYEAEQDWSRYASGYNAAYDQYQKAVEEAEENAKFAPIIVDGENNNGSVSHGNIKTMQRLLGVTEDGYWGSIDFKAAGNRTADDAWEAYLQGKLFGKSKSGMTMEEWEALKQAEHRNDSIGNTGGFTGTTYEEAVAYMKANGVDGSAANVMTRNEWMSRKAAYERTGTGGVEVRNYSSYKEYLADYVEYSMMNKG